MIDKVMEFIKEIQVVLLVVVPAIYGVIYAVIKKVKEKKSKVDNQAITKRVEIFQNWIVEESLKVVTKIKSACNYYKDQGQADLVSFFQLENGTIATSKLHNMFITCLVEDDRYGRLPKMASKYQRIPYGQVSSWVDEVRRGPNVIPHIEKIEDAYLLEMWKEKLVLSAMYEEVRDANAYFIGFVCFEYSTPDFNGQDKENQKKVIHDFRVAIQSIFIDFHISRENKMKELNIHREDISKER